MKLCGKGRAMKTKEASFLNAFSIVHSFILFPFPLQQGKESLVDFKTIRNFFECAEKQTQLSVVAQNLLIRII